MGKQDSFLGIDYGRKKIGLSVSQGFIAEPLKTLYMRNYAVVIKEITKICREKKIQKIILSYPEGQIVDEVKKLARDLKKQTALPLVFWDETLTTKQSRKIMFASGKPKFKRKKEEHQISAALLLQDYLDSCDTNC